MTYKLLCVFLFISLFSNGQFSPENKHKVDSLLRVVITTKESYTKANAYLELSNVYSLIDLDSVIHFADKAETIASQGYKKTSKKAIKDSCTIVIAGANNNIGYAYFNKGDLSNALKHHKKALDLWRALKNNSGTGQSLNNLGVVYKQLGEYKRSLRYFTEALEVFKEEGDEQPIATTYNNLGGIYKMLEKNDQAIESYNHSLLLRRKIGDDRGVATTLNNIGALYKKQGNLDTALVFFEESLALIEKVGDQMGIAHASCNIGEVAFQRNNMDLATQMGERALKIGQDLGALANIEQASFLLQRVYEKTGKWKQAFEMQKLNHETALLIKSEEAKKSAMLLEMQYQFDKEREINRINNQKKLALSQKQKEIQRATIYFITICLILGIIFSFILYQRYRIMRQQKEIIEKQNNERKIMLQEIHHRVKNNFQIISSMLKLQIHKENNPIVQTAFDEAINRIHTMSTVHEIIYKNDALDAVEANSYLENLIANLRRTFENQRVVITIDSCTDPLGLEETIPLGIIVNELITNSFKHAFSEKDEQPKISIQLMNLGGQYVLNYKDNGIGYDPSKSKDSFGIELIETMVEQISGKLEIVPDSQWSTNFKISFSISG